MGAAARFVKNPAAMRSAATATILTHRAYIGKYKFGDILVPDGMPRIIDDEIFQAVQERLKANQRGGKEGRMPNWYNFTGRVWLSGKFDGWYPLIFCVRDSCMGVCAAPVSGRWTLFFFCRMWLGLPIPGGHAESLF